MPHLLTNYTDSKVGLNLLQQFEHFQTHILDNYLFKGLLQKLVSISSSESKSKKYSLVYDFHACCISRR